MRDREALVEAIVMHPMAGVLNRHDVALRKARVRSSLSHCMVHDSPPRISSVGHSMRDHISSASWRLN